MTDRPILETSHMAELADAFTRAGHPMTFGTQPVEADNHVGVGIGLSWSFGYIMPSELLHDRDMFTAWSENTEPEALAHGLTDLAQELAAITALALKWAQAYRDGEVDELIDRLADG